MIYIDQQQKEEWEAKIKEIENKKDMTPYILTHIISGYNTKIGIYKELSSNAIVLPVEESWGKLGNKSVGREYAISSVIQDNYPNGVIIKSQ